jgi:hypothetical protein
MRSSHSFRRTESTQKIKMSPNVRILKTVMKENHRKSVMSRNNGEDYYLDNNNSLKFKIGNVNSLPFFEEDKCNDKGFSCIKDVMRYPYYDSYSRQRIMKGKGALLQSNLRNYCISSRAKSTEKEQSEYIPNYALKQSKVSRSHNFSNRSAYIKKDLSSRTLCKFKCDFLAKSRVEKLPQIASNEILDITIESLTKSVPSHQMFINSSLTSKTTHLSTLLSNLLFLSPCSPNIKLSTNQK